MFCVHHLQHLRHLLKRQVHKVLGYSINRLLPDNRVLFLYKFLYETRNRFIPEDVSFLLVSNNQIISTGINPVSPGYDIKYASLLGVL